MPKQSSPPDRAIAAAISLAIYEHRILPGAKLGEDELAEIFGVSRTIVRAALQSLAHLKLVEMRRNRGAFVAQPSLATAHQVFEARELLEPRTARSAAQRATKSDVAALHTHIKAEHAALAMRDQGRALNLSGQFHIEIARIAGQTIVAGFIESLVAQSSLIIAMYWHRKSALCEKHAHHALVQAISNNDGQLAEELMRSHLVDLHSALDLRDMPQTPQSLKDIFAP